MKKIERDFIVIGAALIISICVGVGLFINNRSVNTNEPKKVKNKSDYSFDANILKSVNKNYSTDNYLISPYSMKLALSMLRDGANGKTKEEIDEVLGNEKIELLNSKERIATSNALFVQEKYEKDILKSYSDLIKKDYDGEILYDEFKSPNIINNWVSKKTYGMINNAVGNIDPSFVLGIVNTLAIDVSWANRFDCGNTQEDEFKNENETYKVKMMHNFYQSDAKYFKTSDSEGVIIPYVSYDENGKASNDEKSIRLEFVGILPNDSVDKYIDSFDNTTIKNIDSNTQNMTNKTRLSLALPKFEYDFTYDTFLEGLKELGITKAFGSEADFRNISTSIDGLSVGEAIHKTYIKLGETGTKAAAVSAFAMTTSALPQEEYKTIEVKFNKPFVYIIRDAKTKQNLFIGVVQKPDIWDNNTCEEDIDLNNEE